MPSRVITVQPSGPEGGLLNSGGKTTLSVGVTGTGIAYQWLKNGVAIANSNAPSLEVTSAGAYTVSATNHLGTVTSNAVLLRIQMSLASLAGEYQGLLLPETETESAHHGIIVATVSKPLGSAPTSLTISGRIQRAESSQSFTGKVDAFGRVTFTTKNLSSLAMAGSIGTTLTLDLLSSSQGRTLEGKIAASGTQKATFIAYPVKAAAGTQIGSYTVLFQQVSGQSGAYPDGDGYATMAVTATRIVLAGKLADGFAVSASFKLTEGETAPIFLPLYKGKGFLSGAVKFDATQDESDAASIGMRWMRAAGVTATPGYTEGWPTGILVDYVASKYDRTKGFGLPNTSITGLNLNFTASGGGLTSPMEATTNLSSRNLLRAPANPIKLTTELWSTSGALKGSFLMTGAKTSSFSGVVFQKTNYASGFFLSGTKELTKSGLIQIGETK